MELAASEGKPIGNGLLITGYVFSLLGGLIGLFIGIHVWRTNVVVQGEKIYKFDEQSRRHGKIMAIISIVLMLGGCLLQMANL
jgi:hypothetical protein